MALKALMLRKKIDDKKALLERLRQKDLAFEKRETELEASINEAQTDEEKNTVSEAVETFDSEKQQHESEKSNLQREIGELETELGELEAEEKKPTPANESRKDDLKTMNTRTKFFGMTLQERNAFFENQGVKDFIANVRTCIKEKRAIANVGLAIPEVALELLKQRVEETSKLISRVNLRHISGTGRQRIMGKIPEAIWTEACAKLNELDLGFSDDEVDGYKVGGFFAVCNAILEDNDVNLMSEILNALGKAIGKAVDKAIIYGTGTKMPLGIVSRLAQTERPANYSPSAREWKNLSATNIITGSGTTGVNLFKEIAANAGALENDYFEGGLTWAMNKKTHTTLTVQSMDKNLNAAIVAGISNSMPVVGGDIVELSFIPDGEIVFGYFDAYLLAERAGTALGQSEHVRFLEDQTVFKGTARYDGHPTIPEAFGVMSITTKAPTTSVDFPADVANAAT